MRITSCATRPTIPVPDTLLPAYSVPVLLVKPDTASRASSLRIMGRRLSRKRCTGAAGWPSGQTLTWGWGYSTLRPYSARTLIPPPAQRIGQLLESNSSAAVGNGVEGRALTCLSHSPQLHCPSMRKTHRGLYQKLYLARKRPRNPHPFVTFFAAATMARYERSARTGCRQHPASKGATGMRFES